MNGRTGHTNSAGDQDTHAPPVLAKDDQKPSQQACTEAIKLAHKLLRQKTRTRHAKYKHKGRHHLRSGISLRRDRLKLEIWREQRDLAEDLAVNYPDKSVYKRLQMAREIWNEYWDVQ